MNDECQQIANRPEPGPFVPHAQSMVHLNLEREPRHEGGSNCQHSDRQGAARRCADHRKRQRVGGEQADIAGRTHRANRPRPADLVAHELGDGTLGAVVLDDERCDRDVKTDAANRFANRIVVGQLLAKSVEPTDRCQRLASKRDRRAETWAREAERKTDQDVWQELVVDRHAGKARRQAVGGDAVVQTRHEADVRRVQFGDRSFDVVAGNRDVAVGDDDDVVSNMRLQSREVRDFRIGAGRGCRDNEPEIELGMFVDQRLDDRNGRIIRVLDAEENLQGGGVMLTAERRQIFAQGRLGAVERLQHGDARRLPRKGSAHAAEAANDDDRRERMDAAAGGDSERDYAKPIHGREIDRRLSIQNGTASAAAAGLLCILLAGCATVTTRGASNADDPLEPINRAVFDANDALDKAIIRPIAEAYRRIVPEFVRDRIRSVIDNLAEPRIFVNDVLQGRFNAAGFTFARFIMNSTAGVGGMFDLATKQGLPRQTGDFGETLYFWGAEPGPYVVLLFFGPSNVRDAFGLGVDLFTTPPALVVSGHAGTVTNFAVGTVDGVDLRARNIEVLDAIKASALDPYTHLKSLTRQRREAELRTAKGESGEPEELTDPEAPTTHKP